MTNQKKADFALILVTMVWGASFIFTKNVIANIPTFTFLSLRFLVATIAAVLLFHKRLKNLDRDTLKYGTIIGIALFLGYIFQTAGLRYTSASKSGFITGFNVVLVPLFSAYLFKNRPNNKAFIGVGFAFVGLFLLSFNESLSINKGDFLTLISAIAYALHIILVGKYTVKVKDSINLAIVQIFVSGILSFFIGIFVESPFTIPTDFYSWKYIIILSMFCTLAAFVTQNIAQQHTTATHTALIYTLEPVFSAIFAFIIAGESLGVRGLIGGVFILIGMLIVEVDFMKLIHKDSIDDELI